MQIYQLLFNTGHSQLQCQVKASKGVLVKYQRFNVINANGKDRDQIEDYTSIEWCRIQQ